MGDFLNSFFAPIAGVISSVFPSSPITGDLMESAIITQGIGWLNWFVPMSGILQMFAAWLTCCVTYVGGRFVVSKVSGVVSGLIGAGSGVAGLLTA